MKKELLTLVIGILIGAVIATGIFLVLQNNSKGDFDKGMETRGQMQERPSMDGNNVKDSTNSVTTNEMDT